MGRITSWSARGSSGTSFSTSAIVWPVMVMQSPCSRPAFSSTFITCGMPPALCRSTARYLPLGFRSQSTGVFLRMRSKSSMVHSTPAACAIARKCSTALVEPPVAMITATAFSIAFLVTMSRGFRSFLIASISTLADSLAEFCLLVVRVGHGGRVGQRDAQRLEGRATWCWRCTCRRRSRCRESRASRSRCRSSSLMLPAAFWPTASNTLTMFRSWPL